MKQSKGLEKYLSLSDRSVVSREQSTFGAKLDHQRYYCFPLLGSNNNFKKIPESSADNGRKQIFWHNFLVSKSSIL